MNHPALKLISGTGNNALAKDIAEALNVSLIETTTDRFNDGETHIQIHENVRGVDAFVIQPTCPPVNENLMELLILIDTLRRASAYRITAVIPYYGYARQDRKDQSRVPITARLVANLISTAGADRVLTIDLHAGQIQGFFDIPVDNLYAAPLLAHHVHSMKIEDLVVVSPDVGGIKRAREFSKRLNVPLAIVDKRRPAPGVVEVANIIGDVKGHNVLLCDDIIDTAGSMVGAIQALREHGAKGIYLACTHAVLSGPAIERLTEANIEAAIITDTIPFEVQSVFSSKVQVLSIAPLLGRAITGIHNETSVSYLFN